APEERNRQHQDEDADGNRDSQEREEAGPGRNERDNPDHRRRLPDEVENAHPAETKGAGERNRGDLLSDEEEQPRAGDEGSEDDDRGVAGYFGEEDGNRHADDRQHQPDAEQVLKQAVANTVIERRVL